MLTLHDVTVLHHPGAPPALRRVSLTFERGVTTVLLGRSGAGKSTLLRCLNHLVVPTSGSVRVEGLGDLGDPDALRAHRRATGVVFQHHQLIGRRTALANTLIGRIGHHSTLRTLFPLPRRDVEIALRCLDRVGLSEKPLRRVDTLSGGERQRVGIARALCQEPSLLLADEPVSSLDPATARSVMSLLAEVSRESGLTLVVSLHQVDLALEVADRIVGLSAGEIVFDGPPHDLDPVTQQRIYRPVPSGRSAVAGPSQPVRSPHHDPNLALPRS